MRALAGGAGRGTGTGGLTRRAGPTAVLPDDTAASAIWVAQRVPTDHVTVLPNIFIVRDVDPDNAKDFLFSANMYRIAKANGWWKEGEALDFTATFSNGEYGHKYYSGRRIWSAYRLLAPSLGLNATYEDYRQDRPYPFSVKPDAPVTPADVMAVMRDVMAGTEFDMTKGLAAGAFGTPWRYTAGKGEAEVAGSWERSIALFRTSVSYVIQLRDWLPDEVGAVVWYGPHGADTTLYVPFPIGMTKVPAAYAEGSPLKLSRDNAFWAHRVVGNIANLKYSYMIKDIRHHQQGLETAGAALVKDLDAHYQKHKDIDHISRAYRNFAEYVVGTWWSLEDQLLEKYADGFVNGEPEGYPAWWLKAPGVGYQDGPGPGPGE